LRECPKRLIEYNEYGDIEPHDCKNKEAFEAKEKDKLLKYLQESNIKSVSLQKSNDLYNGNSEVVKAISNQQLQEIQRYLQKASTEHLETIELQTLVNNQPKSKNILLLAIGGIVFLAISALSIWWFVSRKKRDKL